jgi:transcriptional regulator with XRE-family HTH domain
MYDERPEGNPEKEPHYRSIVPRIDSSAMLGRNVDVLRRQRGISMMELAVISRIDIDTIRKILHGRYKRNEIILSKLANMFNCSVDDLYAP